MRRWLAVPPVLLLLLGSLAVLPPTLAAEEMQGEAAVSEETWGGAAVPEGTSGSAEAFEAIPGGFTVFEAAPGAGAAEYPEGLVHYVEEGDTLWDLSARYLGSPWLWPELWERNRFITNPHYIYPGIRVVVFTPPPREYVMEVWEPEPVLEAPVEEAPPQVAEAVPEAPERPREVLRIPHLDFVRAGEFLLERPEGIGRIRGGVDTRVAFSQGDKVYLSLSREVSPGQLLGVYRVRGPVRPPRGSSVSGYVRYLVGILQVRPMEEGRAAAVVRESFEELSRSDQIREEIPAYSPVVLDPGEENLEAVVLAGQAENTEFAFGHVVYLDKGTDAGVAVGNVFRVFDGQDAATWGAGRSGGRARVEVGRAVVVRALPGTSSAYVIGGAQSFPAGSLARRGAGAGGGTTASR
jgi:hypothetical protein